MGKTLQTIATMMDNRPKLQHCKPGTKHPISNDLKERQEEDEKWAKAAAHWQDEMDILKVVKKIRSRDGGGRAGTLVICPVIALTQWKTEIEKFTDGSLSVCTYHGPDREAQAPREMLKKYDVVLTTYQVVEADFRKMTSPNRVACPNCGGKFKIDKLPIHLKYFCGEYAQKTEAQARQQRTTDRDGPARGRRGRRPDRPVGKNARKDGKSQDTKKLKKQETDSTKQSKKAKPTGKKSATTTNAATKQNAIKKKKSKVEDDQNTLARPSRRNAARKAASQISKSATEWQEPLDDSGSEVYKSESSSTEESEELDSSSDSSDSNSDSSALKMARAKQKEALERAIKSKGKKEFGKGGKKSFAASKSSNKKSFTKKGKKRFDDDFDDDSSSSDDSDDEGADNSIDMDALIQAAMAGGKRGHFI